MVCSLSWSFSKFASYRSSMDLVRSSKKVLLRSELGDVELRSDVVCAANLDDGRKGQQYFKLNIINVFSTRTATEMTN